MHIPLVIFRGEHNFQQNQVGSQLGVRGMQNARTDENPAPMIRKLNDCANLVYLLQEWEALYRQGSAGGSKTIRAHRRRVRGSAPIATPLRYCSRQVRVRSDGPFAA